jgi:hypothetical protein
MVSGVPNTIGPTLVRGRHRNVNNGNDCGEQRDCTCDQYRGHQSFALRGGRVICLYSSFVAQVDLTKVWVTRDYLRHADFDVLSTP